MQSAEAMERRLCIKWVAKLTYPRRATPQHLSTNQMRPSDADERCAPAQGSMRPSLGPGAVYGARVHLMLSGSCVLVREDAVRAETGR